MVAMTYGVWNVELNRRVWKYRNTQAQCIIIRDSITEINIDPFTVLMHAAGLMVNYLSSASL